MAVVGAEIGNGHVQQRLAKFPILAAKLHLARCIDVEELAAAETFPGPRVIPTQHLLGMLAVEAHARKEVVLGQELHVLFPMNGHVPPRGMQQ